MKPTHEDIVKYHSQKYKLLVNIDCYALPIELRISNVVDGGAIFSFGNGFIPQWVKTDQVDVLHVFPPPPRTETFGSIQAVFNKADKANAFTSKLFKEACEELTGGITKKSKKGKKKK